VIVELPTLKAQFEEPHASELKAKLLARLVDPPKKAAKDSQAGIEKDMPQGKAAPQSFVFDIVREDLTLLPAEAIEPVVAYYRLDQRLGSLVDAFSAGVYAGLDDVRQREAVESYFELGYRVLTTALQARDACEDYLKSQASLHGGNDRP
jgi:hypothetical protein